MSAAGPFVWSNGRPGFERFRRPLLAWPVGRPPPGISEISFSIGNTSIQLTQRQLEVPPTLEVPPGYLFNVLVDRDIVLTAPYGEAGVR
jgi:hypothetical protein